MEAANLKTRRVTNFHEVEIPKSIQGAESHDYWGFLYLGIKILDPKVVEIESKPEHIRGANGKAFLPHLRYQTHDHVNTYVVLGASKDLLEKRARIEPLLASFASQRRAQYEFVTHEQIQTERRWAWLGIKVSRRVQQYADVNLDRERRSVHKTVDHYGDVSIEALVHAAGSSPSEWVIAAACGMLINGQLAVVDRNAGLDLRMKVRSGPRFDRALEAIGRG